MTLSREQQDALTELVNIGYGRAAAALSSLVHRRVQLNAPEVGIYTLEELPERLKLSKIDIATVHQIFMGAINGDALLILDYDGAVNLVGLLGDETGEPRGLDVSDRETLLEIGNILLNAFVGAFGNMLNVYVTFAMPRLRLEAVSDMLGTLTVGKGEIRYALLVRTTFTILQSQVGGFVSLVMGIESLDKLFDAMGKAGYTV